jgi:uncharacterized protein
MNYPTEWLQGIEEFNRREYYACHDTLEALWMDAVDPDKRFYQAVLQIAVGCYHLYNRNWQGAVVLLGEGVGKLGYYQPEYAGIDVTKLIASSYNLLQLLQVTGKDRIGDAIDKLDTDIATVPTLTKSEVRSQKSEVC